MIYFNTTSIGLVRVENLFILHNTTVQYGCCHVQKGPVNCLPCASLSHSTHASHFPLIPHAFVTNRFVQFFFLNHSSPPPPNTYISFKGVRVVDRHEWDFKWTALYSQLPAHVVAAGWIWAWEAGWVEGKWAGGRRGKRNRISWIMYECTGQDR